MMRDVELHIGEIVISGIPPMDRYRIGEAVERELARLLSERGFPMGIERDVHVDRVDGGRITVTPGSRGETMGIEIARSLYGSLSANRSNGPINGDRKG